MLTAFIYPEDYFSPGRPDEEFIVEYNIAKELGFEVTVFNQETLLPKNILPEFNYLYRGWMLTPDEYKKLNSYIQNRFGMMLVSPTDYMSTHLYTGAFKRLNSLMPYTSRYLSDTPVEAIVEAVKRDSNYTTGRFFVKDSVKSVKNKPEASIAENISTLGKTIHNFIKEQDTYISDDILIKDFIELDKDVPEVRLWVTNRFTKTQIVSSVHPDFSSFILPKIDGFLLKEIELGFKESATKNSFITIDIAKTVEGKWVVIEIGNGQVSGFIKKDLKTINNVYKMFIQ